MSSKRLDAVRVVVVLATLIGSLLPALEGRAAAAPEAHWTRRFVGNAEDLVVDARGNTFVVGT